MPRFTRDRKTLIAWVVLAILCFLSLYWIGHSIGGPLNPESQITGQ